MSVTPPSPHDRRQAAAAVLAAQRRLGTTIAELVHEEFGDGIVSAIDFELGVERVADPLGDRARITLNGKFLPYRVW